MSEPHPRNPHLKPFQPGQSGNPGGRPKASEAHRLLNLSYVRKLRKTATPDLVKKYRQYGAEPGDTMADICACALLQVALTTKSSAASACKELREAHEGKAAQRVELGLFPEVTPRMVVTFESNPVIERLGLLEKYPALAAPPEPEVEPIDIEGETPSENAEPRE